MHLDTRERTALLWVLSGLLIATGVATWLGGLLALLLGIGVTYVIGKKLYLEMMYFQAHTALRQWNIDRLVKSNIKAHLHS